MARYLNGLVSGERLTTLVEWEQLTCGVGVCVEDKGTEYLKVLAEWKGKAKSTQVLEKFIIMYYIIRLI